MQTTDLDKRDQFIQRLLAATLLALAASLVSAALVLYA
jgi:hypothetical protein